MHPIQRLDASDWPYLLDEPGGASKKHWIYNLDDDGAWLFKAVRVHENGTRSTSDLSEALSCRIAQAIGLPTATYELAQVQGEEGSISRDIALDGFELDEGWKWIRSTHGLLMPSMLRGTLDTPPKPSPDYSYQNLHECLTPLAPPFGHDDAKDGYTLFCGYLLLDAIIANTDRHEANWAVYRAPSGSEHSDMLAPTFDHGAALGQQLQEGTKTALLTDNKRLATWCARGRASRFARGPNGENVSLVEYFVRASQLADHGAIQTWINAVESNLSSNSLQSWVSSEAGMSEVSVTFAVKVVEENVRRVLNEL